MVALGFKKLSPLFDRRFHNRIVIFREGYVGATRFVRCFCRGCSGIGPRLKKSERWPGRALNAPEPTQDVHGENGNARSGGNAGQRLFCAGFTVGEAIAADDDGD